MRKTALCLLLLAAFSFAGLPQAQAAPNRAPMGEAQKAGTQVKTKYFDLTIPSGWLMSQPAKQLPGNDSLFTAFTKEKDNMGMTISVLAAPNSAKEIAEHTAAQMAKNGLKTTQPREKNGFWMVGIDGKAKGEAWFGADGKVCSIITMFGEDLSQANEILGALKGANVSLFPKSIN